MHLLITAMSGATSPSGSCRHAYNLARCAAIRKEIRRITMVVGKWQESYFYRSFGISDSKLEIISVDISNDPFARNIWYLRVLPNMASHVAADIVHLSFPVPFRHSTFGCPVVVSVHDLHPYDEPDNFGFPNAFFNRVFLQRCLKEADRIACVSKTTRSRLGACFPRFVHRKAIVIQNCVTVHTNEPSPPTCESCQFILMVARHCANKNIHLALEVFGDLLRREKISKKTLLLLIGSRGPETAAIKSSIKKRALSNNVKLMNVVSDGELRWLYANCDLLIAPSWMEGFGFPVAEGLLCGCRVVCSNIPAFREVGGEACHYFDLHAESGSLAMATAICTALAEPAKPAERLERFSLEHAADEYTALYTELREQSQNVTRR